MTGRKPLPSAIKKASGAFKKDPQRENKLEPKPLVGTPEMPADVKKCKVAAAKFKEVCGLLRDMKVLTLTDVDHISRYSVAYANWISCVNQVRKNGIVILKANGDLARNPAAVEMHACEAELHKQAVELGLTPSSRTRLKVTEQSDVDDPFSDLLARMGRG